ncbi:hypothetical protein SK224_05395 [Microbacterium sp. BG28]|uniref:hypothetical protein n=1 Tax=Microbacterium sp. BG28 TaxID=3097356 RepID=UPI002A5A2ABA|nr:hypothetical protein [Microbacterium sp. BG28]MDY0828559.1 hypothetical protein [Microbacterium sp. BG28]
MTLYLKLSRRRALRLWRTRSDLRSRFLWRLGFFALADWELELLAEGDKTQRVVRWHVYT